jgi:hypothetical protein
MDVQGVGDGIHLVLEVRITPEDQLHIEFWVDEPLEDKAWELTRRD